ncbi:MAG TPA: class I SAM-dependent methyltransferase [Streptosporangiaceae bacterium]|nr:class I SAM-dependent methyltransferase [Streptosporangiaceae bacterium]
MTVQDGAKQAQGYVFNPTWDQETERLITNEAIWDPGTIERFERLGVDQGWACLEVGAGAGGAAEWLLDRVGPGGRVVAADLEVGRLGRLAERGVEVLRNDLRSEELPAESFDLVHARMLIQHLQDRETAVARLIRALRPGGWLFLEDTDSLPLFRSYRSERFLVDIKEAGYGLMRRAGHEPRGGHFDLEIVLNSELTEVSAEGRVVMVHGGSDQARHYQLWLEFMRSKIVSEGLLPDSRIDEALTEMGDPANRWLSQVLISTFGRKAPATDPGGNR